MKTRVSARDMKRPRIRRTLRQLDAPRGNIYLLDPGSQRDLEIQDADDADRRLLKSLDGTKALRDLEKTFGAARVRSALATLNDWGALEDAADDDRIRPEVLDRFDRQLRYFSDVSPERSPSECQERLEKATVAVLGVGGLGGWSAMSLACCGVGKMILVDFDHVERANLNRQVLYGEADVGRLKIDAAAERLSSLDSKLSIETHSTRLEGATEIRSIIAETQVVIDAVDWPAHHIEHWVNKACFDARVPFISMSHSPPNARVGPFYLPGSTGCYACQEIAYKRRYPLYDLMVEQMSASPSPGAVVGPACAHIGGHVGLDLLHYLTGIARPSTLGTAYIYDLRTMSYRQETIHKEPDCSVCGQGS